MYISIYIDLIFFFYKQFNFLKKQKLIQQKFNIYVYYYFFILNSNFLEIYKFTNFYKNKKYLNDNNLNKLININSSSVFLYYNRDFFNFINYKNDYRLKKINFKFKIYLNLKFNFFKKLKFLNLNFNKILKLKKNNLILPFIKTIYKNKNIFIPSFYFFNDFIVSFLEKFFKKKIYFNIKKLNNISPKIEKKKNYKNLFFKLKNLGSFSKNIIINDLFDILYLTFLLKDSDFFLNWFKYNMENLPLKMHRKFLNLIKMAVTKYFKFLIFKLKIFGLFLNVRGKIGVTGDAKKRTYNISYGKWGYNNKFLKLNLRKSLVFTETGVLGITFCLFFK